MHAERAHEVARRGRIHPEPCPARQGGRVSARFLQRHEIPLGVPERGGVHERDRLVRRGIAGRVAGERHGVRPRRDAQDGRLEDARGGKHHASGHGEPAGRELLARRCGAQGAGAELHAHVDAVG